MRRLILWWRRRRGLRGSLFLSKGSTIDKTTTLTTGGRTWPVEPPFTVKRSGWYAMVLDEQRGSVTFEGPLPPAGRS